jgi:general secretion pathway protein B
MSSILEALERAEEERGRGAKRALGIAPPLEVGSRFNTALILVLAALLLALVLAVWFYRGRTMPTSSVASPPQVEQIVPDSPVQTEAPITLAPAPSKATLSVPDQLRRNAMPSAKPLMDEAVVAKPSPPKPMVTPPAVKPIAVPSLVERRAVAAAPREKAPIEPPASSLESRIVEMAPHPVPAPVMDAPEEPLAEAEAPAPVQSDIPLVWELPQKEREKVLQLKSSVHVYNKDPAQRFVIINMHRYAEGDSLPPDGFRLQRIDQDGVVIDYGGGLVRLLRR